MIEFPGNHIKDGIVPLHGFFKLSMESGEGSMGAKFANRMSCDADIVDCETDEAGRKVSNIGD